MAKTRTIFVCQTCGRTSPKAMGRCPECGSWGSMIEEIESRGSSERRRRATATKVKPRKLSQIEGDAGVRWPLPLGEFARVLGGGIVPGSIVLVGGDPGIGKSTLLLQAALAVAKEGPVLYISGEESEPQIKGRALRLGWRVDSSAEMLLLAETSLENIESQLGSVGPRVAVIDSIQTVQSDDLESSPGSVSQVREAANRLRALAKSSEMAVFLVGHVTKEGALAGPKVLEHIVDTVLYLEGERYHAYRLLRSVKNRFGPTTEVGVFEMRSDGMHEVSNPSQAFLAERVPQAPGSAVAVTMEGTRPLLVELQALTSATSFGHARRTANGLENSRLQLMIAVLDRRVGFRLSDQDVFANVVGGLQVREPAADLALVAALASSLSDRPLPPDLVLIGEVGLSGELRSVAQLDARLAEAAKLGFRRAIIPKSSQVKEGAPGFPDLAPVGTAREALNLALSIGE